MTKERPILFSGAMVRETWAQPTALDPGPTFYRADYPDNVLGKYENLPPAEAITWKPSIHMPHSLSRILLEVTGVRVERLNECIEWDAVAEGVEPLDAERDDPDWSVCPRCGGTGLYTAFGGKGGAMPDTDCSECDTHVKRYQHLWDAINGAGAWQTNPWVLGVGVSEGSAVIINPRFRPSDPSCRSTIKRGVVPQWVRAFHEATTHFNCTGCLEGSIAKLLRKAADGIALVALDCHDDLRLGREIVT